MLDKVEGVGKYVSCRQLVKRGNNSSPTLQLALFFALSPTCDGASLAKVQAEI